MKNLIWYFVVIIFFFFDQINLSVFGPGSRLLYSFHHFWQKKSRYPRECVFLFVSHLSAPSLCVTLNYAQPDHDNIYSNISLLQLYVSFRFRRFFVSCSDKNFSQATHDLLSLSVTRYSKTKWPGLWCAIKKLQALLRLVTMRVCVCVRRGEEALLSHWPARAISFIQ